MWVGVVLKPGVSHGVVCDSYAIGRCFQMVGTGRKGGTRGAQRGSEGRGLRERPPLHSGGRLDPPGGWRVLTITERETPGTEGERQGQRGEGPEERGREGWAETQRGSDREEREGEKERERERERGEGQRERERQGHQGYRSLLNLVI